MKPAITTTMITVMDITATKPAYTGQLKKTWR
jgi:hypothetical protein